MSEYIFKLDQLSKDFENFFHKQRFEFGTPMNSMTDKWNIFLHDVVLPKKHPAEKFFSFYSIDPSRNFEVIGHYGITEYLNLTELFTCQSQLMQFIHPKQLPFFLSLAQAVISFTTEDLAGRVGFDKEIKAYQVTVPMKLRDGKYYRVEQLTQPVSLDKKGRVVGVLNRYRLFGEYQGEPLKPYFHSNGKMEDADKISKKFSLRARTFWKNMYDSQNLLLPFTPSLAKSLIYYSRKENYGQTAAVEGKKRGYSTRTCTDYRTKIIVKSKALTGRRFPDVFSVVDYFIEQGFLPGRNRFIPAFEDEKEDS